MVNFNVTGKPGAAVPGEAKIHDTDRPEAPPRDGQRACHGRAALSPPLVAAVMP